MKKLFFKKQKKTILGVAIAMAGVISLAGLVQACSGEFDFDVKTSNEINQYKEYLDVDISNYDVLISSEKILMKGFNRIEPYIQLINNQYVCTANSAKEINMSQRLFDFLTKGVVNDIQNNFIPRLKGGIEYDYGIGYYSYTITMSNTEFLNYVNSVNSVLSAVGYSTVASNSSTLVNALKTAGIPLAFISTIVSTRSFIESYQWGNVLSDYINNSNHNGVTMTQFTFTGSSVPSYSVYSIIHQ